MHTNPLLNKAVEMRCLLFWVLVWIILFSRMKEILLYLKVTSLTFGMTAI